VDRLDTGNQCPNDADGIGKHIRSGQVPKKKPAAGTVQATMQELEILLCRSPGRRKKFFYPDSSGSLEQEVELMEVITAKKISGVMLERRHIRVTI
jgi:uncharacterized NAD-dependent epimerase/dehydratase family protein